MEYFGSDVAESLSYVSRSFGSDLGFEMGHMHYAPELDC
jgi:hypothetical protein